jgi:hypothetical protein
MVPVIPLEGFYFQPFGVNCSLTHGFCLQSHVCEILIAAWLTDFLLSHPKN